MIKVMNDDAHHQPTIPAASMQGLDRYEARSRMVERP